VLETMGIGEDQFMEHIRSFPGADKRLEIVAEDGTTSIFRDFAHAPSKVKASVSAVKDREPGRTLAVFLELHTYSSLNIDFLSEYKGSLEAADRKYIYIDDHAIRLKNLKPVGNNELHAKFNDPSIRIIRSPAELIDILKNLRMKNINLLFMSSGNFGGVNVIQILDINNKL
jgi:UDP-N-acetylmuramate: L-alanyl-gamma-D-glutamyl-meso-diaminopimelate ligase